MILTVFYHESKETRVLCKKTTATETVSSLLLWLMTLILGYAYVSVILCHRWLPFRSGNNPCQDFLVLVGICSLLYWLGPVHNFEFKPPFVFAFFAALHWAFLGDMLGAHFSLTPDSLANLDSVSMLALLAAAFCVVAVFGYHAYRASHVGQIAWYLTAFAIPIVIIAWVTVAMAKTHYLHVHHYCVGLLLFPFCRFRSAISMASQGFFLGLAVEGVARWGMDPVWCFR